MIGHLYCYPDPTSPNRYLYVGQGKNRDSCHRSGRTAFGRRFKQKYPAHILPSPVRWVVNVSNQNELNEEETIAMFVKRTWCGYGGMNLSLPGSQDYCRAGTLAARLWDADHQVRCGKLGGKARVASGQFAKLKTFEHQSRAGVIGGKVGGKIGGKVQGHRNAMIPGHMKLLGTLGDSTNAGRKTYQNRTGIFAMTAAAKKLASQKGTHCHWHVGRKIDAACFFCKLEETTL